MLITDIVRSVNTYLDGERLRFEDILPYLDASINRINSALHAKFPTFSKARSLPDYNGVYTYFPEEYVESVVVPFVAYSYYSQDEEGEHVSGGYYNTFQENLFYMVRDYMPHVPEEFIREEGGMLTMTNIEVTPWHL